jgi:hypothetical protein
MNKDKKEAIEVIKECDSFMVVAQRGHQVAFNITQQQDKQREILNAFIGVLTKRPEMIPAFECATQAARDIIATQGRVQPPTWEEIADEQSKSDGIGLN